VETLGIRRARLLVVLLAIAAGVAAVVVHHYVFPSYSTDHDEPVYVLQAKMLQDGHISLPGSQELFFRPWLSGPSGDRLISVFQPVWPAVLMVADLVTGSWIVAQALVAAGVIVLVYLLACELRFDRATALVAAFVVAFSPLAFIRSGTLLAYHFSLLLLLAYANLFLRARRTGSIPLYGASGLLLGLLFFTRPFDALLIGVSSGVWTLVQHRRDLPALVRIGGAVLLGALPFVALTFLYNWQLTGNPLHFPLHTAGGNNNFGFGDRYIAAGTPIVHVGVRDALAAMRETLRSFIGWEFGGVVLLPLAAVAVWRLRDRPAVVGPLLLVMVLWPLANLFYWGNLLIAHGPDYLGPHYYVPILVPLALLAAHTFVGLARERRVVAAALGAVMIVVTVVETVPKIDINLRRTDLHEAEAAAVHAATGPDDPAVVIVPRSADGGWILHPRPNLENEPDLSNRVLYAIDRDGRNLELFDEYGDRPIFQLSFVIRGDVDHAEHEVRRLERLVGSDAGFDWTVTNQSGAPVVGVYLTTVIGRIAHYVLDDNSQLGATYHGTWTLMPNGEVTLDSPGARLVTPMAEGIPAEGMLSVGASFGPDDDMRRSELAEWRYWFRAGGAELEVVSPGTSWTRDGPPGFLWLPRFAGDRLEVGSVN
jgi:4-amino-4-deoxy-L-arabinose transferase-like glycosyltransferase